MPPKAGQALIVSPPKSSSIFCGLSNSPAGRSNSRLISRPRPAAARSRATPITPLVSGRFGVTSKSITGSPPPSASTIGVQFHEGRLFGPANQIINLAAILILIALALTGPVMWWKRRPKGKLAPPVVPRDTRLSIGVLTIATALALILPLFALSVLLILAGEWVWARRTAANA